MLNRRSTRPTRVTRGSSQILKSSPSLSLALSRLDNCLSAPLTMVRNFIIENGLPSMPIRSDE